MYIAISGVRWISLDFVGVRPEFAYHCLMNSSSGYILIQLFYKKNLAHSTPFILIYIYIKFHTNPLLLNSKYLLSRKSENNFFLLDEWCTFDWKIIFKDNQKTAIKNNFLIWFFQWFLAHRTNFNQRSITNDFCANPNLNHSIKPGRRYETVSCFIVERWNCVRKIN